MALKENFYAQLEQDLARNGARSFLAGYLREHHPPGGAYRELSGLWAQLKAGKCSAAGYRAAARRALASGRRIGLSQKSRAVLTDPAAPVKALERAHRELLDCLLVKSAKDYIYNAGRKQDSSLALLEAWMETSGESGGGSLSPQELADWRTLYDILCRRAAQSEEGLEQAANIFCPVWVDPRSAAGVYLTGQDYFSELTVDHRPLSALLDNRPCWFTLFLFGDFYSPDPTDDFLMLRWNYALADTFPLGAGEGKKDTFAAILVKHMCFTDPEKALAALKELNQSALSGYRYENYAPPGCPPSLRRYFELGEEDGDFSELMAAGMAGYAADKPKAPPRQRPEIGGRS